MFCTAPLDSLALARSLLVGANRLDWIMRLVNEYTKYGCASVPFDDTSKLTAIKQTEHAQNIKYQKEQHQQQRRWNESKNLFIWWERKLKLKKKLIKYVAGTISMWKWRKRRGDYDNDNQHDDDDDDGEKRWRGKKQWAERCFHVIKYNYFRVYSIRIAIFSLSLHTFAPYLILAWLIYARFMHSLGHVFVCVRMSTAIPELAYIYRPQLPSRYFSFQFRFFSLFSLRCERSIILIAKYVCCTNSWTLYRLRCAYKIYTYY